MTFVAYNLVNVMYIFLIMYHRPTCAFANIMCHHHRFSIPAFPWESRGQQPQIQPPHITILYHLLRLAEAEPQAIPPNAFHVAQPFQFWSFNRPFTIRNGSQSLFWKSFLRHSAYMAKPSKLWSLVRRSSNSTFSELWISKLHTLSSKVTPLILRKNLISDACTRDRILSVITQDSRP